MYAFWLVLTYDLLEDRSIDDVIIKTFFFNSLLYKTIRFQVAVRLFSNRSQRTPKCGKNISDTLGCASCATFLFLPHFDVICDLLLNRRTATWNLFVNYLWSKMDRDIYDCSFPITWIALRSYFYFMKNIHICPYATVLKHVAIWKTLFFILAAAIIFFFLK